MPGPCRHANRTSAACVPLQKGVHVVSASYASYSMSTFEHRAIQALGDAGALFVAAAGNEALDTDSEWGATYPATYNLPNIVAGVCIGCSGVTGGEEVACCQSRLVPACTA